MYVFYFSFVAYMYVYIAQVNALAFEEGKGSRYVGAASDGCWSVVVEIYYALYPLLLHVDSVGRVCEDICSVVAYKQEIKSSDGAWS